MPPACRDDYVHFMPITTRWLDNDAYGHINNVVYYSFFDTVVNAFLIGQGVLDIDASPVIGLVIGSECSYLAPVAFPQTVTAGLRVGHLGTSSVRYEIGIFRDAEHVAAAHGRFTHVYVERATRRPVRLPPPLRAALTPLVRIPASDERL
jgi:acyl-CoA thioester hydrolase